MEYLEKLKELLNRYIEENKTLREKMERAITLKILYEDLINSLDKDYQTIKDNKLGIIA